MPSGFGAESKSGYGGGMSDEIATYRGKRLEDLSGAELDGAFAYVRDQPYMAGTEGHAALCESDETKRAFIAASGPLMKAYYAPGVMEARARAEAHAFMRGLTR